jgi:hypothetical protein
VAAHAGRAVDNDPAVSKRVEAVRDVHVAKVAAAEGAFGGGMGATLFHAAKPDGVSLADALPILLVVLEIVVLEFASVPGTDGLVILEVVSVGGTEAMTAVLARGDSRLLTLPEEPADSASLIRHGEEPLASIVAGASERWKGRATRFSIGRGSVNVRRALTIRRN